MNEALLADLVSAVEQQLTSPSTPYVSKTFQRLTSLGLDPTEAKTQIAICLGEEMDEVMRQKRAFDEKAYRKSLDALPMEDDETDDPNPENPEP